MSKILKYVLVTTLIWNLYYWIVMALSYYIDEIFIFMLAFHIFLDEIIVSVFKSLIIVFTGSDAHTLFPNGIVITRNDQLIIQILAGIIVGIVVYFFLKLLRIRNHKN